MECVFFNYRIRVQYQYIFPFCLAYCLIVGFCKAYVFPVFDKLDIRKFFIDHLAGAINGIVICYNYLSINSCKSLIDGEKTLFQEVFYIIVDYNDR